MITFTIISLILIFVFPPVGIPLLVLSLFGLCNQINVGKKKEAVWKEFLEDTVETVNREYFYADEKLKKRMVKALYSLAMIEQ